MIEIKERKDEFDIAKAIGVFLVIFGHMPSVIPEGIRIWIFSFHMPLFYFVAGYFAKDIKDVFELKEVIKKKWKGLMVPYFIYSFVFLAVDLLSARINQQQILYE